MTSGLPAIAQRLAKLVPVLGSDQPGEVVAAADAIGRALRGAGLDWHDLAVLVSAGAVRQAAAGFTFASLPPRTARKQLALLGRQAGLTGDDRCRLDRLRAWLHGQRVDVRMPADHLGPWQGFALNPHTSADAG